MTSQYAIGNAGDQQLAHAPSARWCVKKLLDVLLRQLRAARAAAQAALPALRARPQLLRRMDSAAPAMLQTKRCCALPRAFATCLHAFVVKFPEMRIEKRSFVV